MEAHQHRLWQHGQCQQAHRHCQPRIRAHQAHRAEEAAGQKTLIDATYGRRTRAVIITDSDHVILSAVQPETVANRLNDEDDEAELDDDE